MQEQQAVFVYLPWIDFDRLLTLSEELVTLCDGSCAGEFDGNEVDDKSTILFFYGPDAEARFAFVWPALTGHSFCEGARVTLRMGPPGAPRRSHLNHR